MKTVADIAAGVAEQFGISKTEAEKYTKHAFAEVAKGLSSGDEVNIHGFGKFSVSERAAREGRNPATGEAIQIAASSNVKFKAAKALKDTL